MRAWHVALVVALPPRLAAEVDGLRLALGDPTLARVPAHLTIVPPVTVRDPDLGEALRLLRHGAADVRPFAVRIGPLASFAPVTPTVHLAVEDSGELGRLRDAVFHGPWWRNTLPFVPHVTLLPHAPQHVLGAARVALRHFRGELVVERLTAMVERRHPEAGKRRWEAMADADLGGSRVVGRGGLPLELCTGTVLDPEVRRALALPTWPDEDGFQTDLVVEARREGEVVGAAWLVGDGSGAAPFGSPSAGGAVGPRQVGAHLGQGDRPKDRDRPEHADRPFGLAVVGHARGQGVGRQLRSELEWRLAQRAAAIGGTGPGLSR